MTDNDKLVQLGNEYNEDAKSIRELMNAFKKQTENLQHAMNHVDIEIGEISGTVETSMEHTVNVSNIAEQMAERIKENNKGISML
ncbi:hypothetical protein [Cellulosilyticum ruminicola]|uniref:hypothetical protein n=1 Tax=Cellulosilyticum ruminicola TaxID=425254 RepID=UPI0006D24927|nr:hypothetical protein [Cellulosilyticum ruminicola]